MQPPYNHPVTPMQPSCNHHNRHAITMHPSCNHHGTITHPPYNHQAKAPCNRHFFNHPPTHLDLAVRRSTRARGELGLGSFFASIKPLDTASHCSTLYLPYPTYLTLHYIKLYSITLYYISLHYVTLQYSTLQYITLPYLTQPYLT